MKKSISVVVGAAVAATLFAPTAYARHRHAPAMTAPMAPAANPRMDKDGQFYATPVSNGPMAPAGLPVPGLDLAGGVVNGVASPLLAAPGAIVNGVTQPLLPPPS